MIRWFRTDRPAMYNAVHDTATLGRSVVTLRISVLGAPRPEDPEDAQVSQVSCRIMRRRLAFPTFSLPADSLTTSFVLEVSFMSAALIVVLLLVAVPLLMLAFDIAAPTSERRAPNA